MSSKFNQNNKFRRLKKKKQKNQTSSSGGASLQESKSQIITRFYINHTNDVGGIKKTVYFILLGFHPFMKLKGMDSIFKTGPRSHLMISSHLISTVKISNSTKVKN